MDVQSAARHLTRDGEVPSIRQAIARSPVAQAGGWFSGAVAFEDALGQQGIPAPGFVAAELSQRHLRRPQWHFSITTCAQNSSQL